MASSNNLEVEHHAIVFVLDIMAMKNKHSFVAQWKGHYQTYFFVGHQQHRVFPNNLEQ